LSAKTSSKVHPHPRGSIQCRTVERSTSFPTQNTIIQYKTIERSAPANKDRVPPPITPLVLQNSCILFNYQIKSHFAPECFSSLCCWDSPLKSSTMFARSITGFPSLEDINVNPPTCTPSASLRAVKHTKLLGFPPLGDQHCSPAPLLEFSHSETST